MRGTVIIGVGTERRRGEGGPGDFAARAAHARGGQGVWEISPLAVLGGVVGSTPFQACCLVSWARLSGFIFQEIPCSEFLIFQEIHCSENTLSQSEKHR